MKTLLILLILTSIQLSSLAQKEVFRIDSIPSKGILLDKGWKWHAGDNFDFAKPDFDDSQWESIDPTKDLMDLPQIPRNGKIGWLRLKFKIDTSLTNSVIGATINQVGASEIYIDGKLLIKFGKISNNLNELEGYNPTSEPTKNNYIFTAFSKNSECIIAVRYALQPNILYIKSTDKANPIFDIVLKDARKLNENNIENNGFDASIFDIFRSGMFFILGILHVLLFLLNRKKSTNLYISFYYFSGFLLFLTFKAYDLYAHSISLRMDVAKLKFLFAFSTSIATPEILYSLFKSRKQPHYWVLLSIPFLFFFFIIKDYKFAFIVGSVYPIILNLEGIRITILAIKKKKKESWLILIGIFSFVLFYAISVVVKSTSPFSLIQNLIIDNICFSLSLFIFPIVITIILARDFTNTSKSLTLKLAEVQQLSLEKQEALQKQNAELQTALLQGQTIERKRVAADLHDSLGSTMSSLIYTVNAIDTKNLDEQEQKVYLHLKQMLDTAYNEIRLLSYNLLPEEFEKQGLAEALRYFVRKINQTKTIQFDLSIDPQLGRLSPKIEFELYSICLELINNILKHAHATQASIALAREKNKVQLTIADNGRGFFDNSSDGKGIKNVKARVESLNGTWKYDSKTNEGTSSTISIPV
jgi:signal transduction histidine kinase